MTEDAKKIIPPEGRSEEYITGWHLADGLAEDGRDITHLEPQAEWPAETRMGFRMRVIQAQKPLDIPALPPPAGCSREYAEGWEFAESWLRAGGSINDPPGVRPVGMTQEEEAGFTARLLKAVEPNSGQVLAFRPRQRPA
ncbi:MAG TPA: hypothetical protein VFA39_20100 [Steroidobacteraceae bacterium]|nr:hypothetical protein [Steroidobacteraceae bacterium]